MKILKTYLIQTLCVFSLCATDQQKTPEESSRPETIRLIQHSAEVRGNWLSSWLMRLSMNYRYHPFGLFNGILRPFLGVDGGIAYYRSQTQNCCHNFNVQETQIYSSLLPGIILVQPNTKGLIIVNAVFGYGKSYVGLDERSADTYTILSDSYSASGVIQGFDISLISYLTGNYAATLGLHFGMATMYAIDHQVRYTENGSEYFRQYNSGSIRPLSYRMGFSLGTAF